MGSVIRWTVVGVGFMLMFFSLWALTHRDKAVLSWEHLYTERSETVVKVEPYLSVPELGLPWGHSYAHGSGVVINHDGFVLTAAHVVKLSAVYNIKMKDGTLYEAGVLGVWPEADLALLQPLRRRSNRRLQFAILGLTPQVGEAVSAIGCPMSLEWAMTAGIVSMLGDQFIVSDTALMFGSSGGPLFNQQGELVGVAQAIYLADGKSLTGYTSFARTENIKKFLEGWGL